MVISTKETLFLYGHITDGHTVGTFALFSTATS